MLDFLRSRGFFREKNVNNRQLFIASSTAGITSGASRWRRCSWVFIVHPYSFGWHLDFGIHGRFHDAYFQILWPLWLWKWIILLFGFILRLTASNGWAMFTELERIWITRMNINTPVDMEYHEVIRCHNVNRTFCTSKQTCHFLCSKLEKLSPSLPLQQATLNLTNEVFPNLEANSSPKWSVENVDVS